MKAKLVVSLSAILFYSSAQAADLVISGVLDGNMSGGVPKAVELYVANDISDLSQCGLGTAFNGHDSSGQQMSFDAVAKAKGSYIYVSYESASFTQFFGFSPDYVSNALSINGDDVVELYCDGSIVDAFGQVGVDGTGTAWEYKDSWAYRNNDTVPELPFNAAHWHFGPFEKNVDTNAANASPFPLKTFTTEIDPNDPGSGVGGDDPEPTPTPEPTPGEPDPEPAPGNGGDESPCFNCTELTPVADPATFSDSDYYANASAAVTAGDSPSQIKAAISTIISQGQRKLTYGEVWTALTHTDEDPDNPDNVILIYSGKSIPKHSNGSGSQSANPDNWNREHTWAKSHGFPSQANEAYTDINHLRPADISINSARGNLDFDDSDNPLAEDPEIHVDSDSFEPRDEVKGDIARMLMYMDTRYEGNGSDVTPDLQLVDHITQSGEPELGKLCRLLQWNDADPVSDFERKRNDAIYEYQGNRNPYIDHPEWVDKVYGDVDCSGAGSGEPAPSDPDQPAPSEPEPVVTLGQCGDEATLISAVQGAGDVSPLEGQTVVIEGVVTALADDLNGYFVQEEIADEDGDDTTSEGVFVYARNLEQYPTVGSVVRVLGSVSEYYDKTEFSQQGTALNCGTGQARLATVTLPLPENQSWEAYEGMQVQVTGDLVVTDNYDLGQYGEVTLASHRLLHPTHLYAPGSAEQAALAAANARDQIVLDDKQSRSYPEPIIYPSGGLSASNTVRVGDTVSNVRGIVDYNYDVYRIRPSETPVFAQTNPRTDAPDVQGGNLRLASLNVLNLFNGDGQGGGFPTERGADSEQEYERQVAKTVAAITAIDADVVGLMEIENDGFAEHSAIADLVQRLNAQLGEGTYAFVDAGHTIGTDAITSALLYKPAAVTPEGAVQIDNDEIFNRPPVAQTFLTTQSNDRITVVVNHFRSKSCSHATGDNADQDDGQGCHNATRVEQATALLNWLQSNSALAEQTQIAIVGDLNAYAKEDPITTLEQGGFVNLIAQFEGDNAYSYVYNGESGYMDHILVTAALADKAVAANDWHINADEPPVLDYNVEHKSPQQVADYYAADAYRESDHDPAVAAFTMATANDEPSVEPPADSSEQHHHSGGAMSVLMVLLFPLAWYRRQQRKRYCA